MKRFIANFILSAALVAGISSNAVAGMKADPGNLSGSADPAVSHAAVELRADFAKRRIDDAPRWGGYMLLSGVLDSLLPGWNIDRPVFSKYGF